LSVVSCVQSSPLRVPPPDLLSRRRSRRSLIAVTVVLAACVAAASAEATIDSARYTLAPTKRCLATRHAVKHVGRAGFLVIDTAPGGAINVVVRTRNNVKLGFYRSAPQARSILALVTRVRTHRGQSSPTAKFHTRRNVYLGWTKRPSAAELRAVEDCLR
jgi:hypothetical protein